MANFQQQLKKAKNLQQNKLKDDLFKFIRSIEVEILEKNKSQLKDDSKDIFGKPIGFYSQATEVMTGGRKAKGQPFDAFETGDFLKGFYMQEVSGVLRFGSKDEKTQTILKSDNWLSDQLFGLSDKNLKEVIEKRLLPFFIDNARNKLGI